MGGIPQDMSDPPPAGANALDTLADALNLRARLAYAGGACGQWVMDHNSDTAVWFHLVLKGRCWAHSPAFAEPLPLAEGDLLLFLPHAATHYLSYRPDHLPADNSAAVMTTLGEGEAGFLCGEIRIAAPHSLLWRALPTEILVRRSEAGASLAALIELASAEAARDRFGARAIVERLCDSFFILAIRHCLESGAARQGLLAALSDRRVAAALDAIHTEPWRAWTLNELCARSALSKTALAEKFAALIGASPIEYLIDLRMQIAARWLGESGLTIERLAERCGYESAASFGKAFKRVFGVSPARYRRQNSGAVD